MARHQRFFQHTWPGLLLAVAIGFGVYTYQHAAQAANIVNHNGNSNHSEDGNFNANSNFNGNENTNSGDGGGEASGNNTVSVTVADETGNPLSGITVYAYCGSSYNTGVTGDEGTVEISGMANGNCGVWLNSGEYYSDYQQFTFTYDDTAKTQAVSMTATALQTTLEITVVDSTEAPHENATVYLTDTSGHEFYGSTDSSGQASLGVLYGTYTVDGYIQSGADEGEYFPPSSVTVSETGVAVDGNTHTLTIQTQAYSSHIAGTVTSAANGSAVTPRLLVYSDEVFHFTFGQSDGTYNVGLIPGTYTVKAESDGYANGILENVVVAEGETLTGQDIALGAADNQLTVNLVDTDGNAITSSTIVFCKDPAVEFSPANLYFSFDSEGGTTTFDLPDGTYACDVFLDGYVVVSSPSVTLAGGTAETVEVTLQQYDATVTVNVVDETGAAVNEQFGVFGVSDEGYSFTGFSMTGGTTDVGVLAGTYKVRVYVMGSGYAVDYGQSTEVTVASGETAETTITVANATSTLAGTVTDADGDPVADSLVTASNNTYDFSTFTDADGNYSMTVVDGKYNVAAASDDGSALPSESDSVTVDSDETADHDLALQTGTAILTVTPEGSETAAELTADEGSCYAYAEDGTYVKAAIDTDSNTAELPVTAGSWTYGCNLVIADTVYATPEEQTVTVKTDGDKDVSVDVVDSAPLVDDVLVQFTATVDVTLDVGDVEIYVPANTLDTSGNASIMISSATDVVVENGEYPLAPIELVARDSNNRILQGDFNNDVTVTFHYDEEDLADYGIAESSLAGQTNDDGASYVTDQGYSVDTENNTVAITTNDFSSFSIVGDTTSAAAEQPGKPKALKATKVKQHTAVLTWKKPSSGTVTKYKVQLRKHGVKKAAKWTTYKKVEVKQKKVKDLKSNTRYQFRVKACNGSSCSKYTKWEGFKTK